MKGYTTQGHRVQEKEPDSRVQECCKVAELVPAGQRQQRKEHAEFCTEETW
eukprot:CAMPEP_0194514460 /NCGR_PEP_ID=MMETSP0253-20130528/46927_1 /TAXON_ID=2966 /ORGANISM="Noctiluca scintillans" /LENGTH=50 /DNA_ID=CAMNT_0039358121 /DNA_START=424 /DNA_END=576 /DNA_ORIENTATION=-